MKKGVVKIVALIVILILSLNTIVIAASSQLQDVDKKIKEKEAELNGIQEEKSDTMQQVENISSEITQFEDEINELDGKILELNSKITEAQDDLNKAQDNYTKQEELLKERLIATYEAGQTSYLDVILSSKSLTDFISNYYLVTQIAKNDKALMQKILEEKKQIQTAKETLETSKSELDTSKSTKKNKQNQLEIAKKEKNKKVAELSADEKETQSEIDKFEADKAAIKAEIAAASKKYTNSGGNKGGNTSGGNSGPGKPSASGFMRPVSASVTCGWLGYPGHYGIDYGASYGTPVYASKSGVVFKSLTKTGDIPNYGSDGNYVGSFSSYGEQIIIDHEDGTMTLYAHGKPGSRLVSKGQRVSQGQQIMSVGNTGNVKPRPTQSNPTNGTHLHFEIFINGIQVNPANYV